MKFSEMIEILIKDCDYGIAQELALYIHPTGDIDDILIDWLWNREYDGNETEDSLWVEWTNTHSKSIQTVHLI